jgi:ATP-dependent DNA ligase
MGSTGWWMYPMKPVRVRASIFETVNPDDYFLEMKYDGFRAILAVEGGQPKLWTRDHKRLEMPDNLMSQLQTLDLPDSTVLDGEIWTPTKRGAWRHDRTIPCLLTFWDAIRSDARDISGLPIESRRDEMARLLQGGTQDIGMTSWLPATVESHNTILKRALEHREESRSGFIHGVVLKKKGSPRRDHATRCVEHPDWLKIVFDGMQSGSVNA